MREACGVFGVYAPSEDVSRLIYFGLYALQHRGQESAGIAVSDGKSVVVFKEMGLVSQVFDEAALLSLPGHLGVGHVRYSTTGSTHWENAQPVHSSFKGESFAVAHNGNLVNTLELKNSLASQGILFRSTSDTEIVAALISNSTKPSIEDAICDAVSQLKGAFSLAILSEKNIFAVRDPWGIRPLCIGKLPHKNNADTGGYVISSETCALDTIGAEFIRDVNPGEFVSIGDKGIKQKQALPKQKSALCVFEYIYFARPDSILGNKSLFEARRDMGKILAGISPVEADLVVGVPDSGIPAAIGYAEASGIPYSEGLIKNRYIGRTFIQPTQALRQQGIRLKLNPLKKVISGKRLVVVDDSIVRGNTSRKIVSILRSAGAKEVHMRISSPPVCNSCYYGIDTANKDALIASSLKVKDISISIGVDTLAYLDSKGLIEATGHPTNTFCMACFNGIYPIAVSSELPKKEMLEKIST